MENCSCNHLDRYLLAVGAAAGWLTQHPVETPVLVRISCRSSGTKLCADAAKLRLQTCGADNFRNWTSAAIVFVWPCARRRAESHKDMIPRWPELACGLRSSACS